MSDHLSLAEYRSRSPEGISPGLGRSGAGLDAARKPFVLVPSCNRMIGQHPFHIAGRKYIEAVRLAGCQPLVVPGADVQEMDALLELAEGVLLTGSPSNVHPRRPAGRR